MQNKENLNSGHRQRIKERFIKYGYDALLDYEKLELFLTLCIPRKDVKDIAKNLLNKFGSIGAVLNAYDSDLSEVSGVGESVICNIKIVKMLINAHLFESLKENTLSLDSVELIAKYFDTRMATLEYEVIEMLCLDSQLRLLGSSAIRISEGSVDFVNIDMRKIIEIAFKNSASNIVIAHNHPRGEAVPSKADMIFTKEISKVCKSLKLDFIEHIIIARDKYFSFRRQGHLDLLYDSTLAKSASTKVALPRKTLK